MKTMKTTTEKKGDGLLVIRIAGDALPARRGRMAPPTRRHNDKRRKSRVNQKREVPA